MASRHPPRHQPAQPSQAIDSLISRFAGWAMVEMGTDEAPLPECSRLEMVSRMRDALEELRSSPMPTPEAWRQLADLCNYLETMGALGYASMTDVNAITQPAINALDQAARRHQQQGLPIRLDGPGLRAIGDALQVWGDVLAEITEQAARHITLVTQHRCSLILQGKTKPRDIVIAL